MKLLLPIIVISVVVMLTGCSEIDYTHPLDSKGTYDHPEDFLDDDGDGTANIWDPQHPRYQSFKDTTAPVIKILEGDTVRIPVGDPDNRVNYYAGKYTVTDNDPKVTMVVLSEFPLNSAGTFKIEYTATDNENNSTTVYRVVIIYKQEAKDTIAPNIFFTPTDTTFVIRGNVFNSLENVLAFDTGTVNDGNVTSRINVSGTVDINKTGTYKLTYSVSDYTGNTGTKERIVVVKENQSNDDDWPVITLKGTAVMAIQQGEAFTDPGYTAYDSTDGDISAKVTKTIVPQPFNASKPAAGQYTMTYQVMDNAGHSISEIRTLTVRGNSSGDTLPPTIVLTNKKDSVTTISLGLTWKKPDLTVQDNVDKLSSDSVKVSNPPNTSVAGTYIVTLYVSDMAGNTGTLKIKVIVADIPRDKTPPVITILGDNPDTIGTGTTFIDKGARAIDSADGDITVKITKDSKVNTATAGTYTVTYTVKDIAGNEAKGERTVVVMDGVVEKLISKYGVPVNAPLPTMTNASFSTATTEGNDMPSITALKELKINWSLEQKGLYDFSLSFSDTRNYISLNSSLTTTHTFGSAKPTVTLTGLNSKIPNFDGTYYVKVEGTSFIWVKTDGSCAIVWKK